LSQSLKSINHLLRKLEVILMKSKLLRRLSVLILSVTVCPLPLPNTSAADDTYGTAYTTAVVAREVQMNTIVRWESGGSLLSGSSSPSAAHSSLNVLLYDHRLSHFHPRAESLDITLLYQLTEMFSLYGGGWFLSAAESGSLKPRAAKFGLDFASPWLFLDRTIQPVGATEFRSHKGYDWSADFSVRAGLRWNDTRAPDRSLSLMLEGFVGNSQSTVPGSRQKINYLGLGFHYAW
jgi:uncharacterized protein DUF1207